MSWDWDNPKATSTPRPINPDNPVWQALGGAITPTGDIAGQGKPASDEEPSPEVVKYGGFNFLKTYKKDSLGNWVAKYERIPETAETASEKARLDKQAELYVAQAESERAQSEYYKAQAWKAMQPPAPAAPVAPTLPSNVIEWLTQDYSKRVAAGEMTAPQAMEEMGKLYQKWQEPATLEARRTQAVGLLPGLMGQEQEHWRGIAPYILPESTQYYPGFEPGGGMAGLAALGGAQYNPELSRVNRTPSNSPMYQSTAAMLMQLLGGK